MRCGWPDDLRVNFFSGMVYLVNSFDLIIFDCDGTLTDSEYLNNQALLDVLHAEGLTHYTLDHAYKHWVGTTVSSILQAIKAETGRELLPENVIPRYIKRVTELQHTALKPVDGAPELVPSDNDPALRRLRAARLWQVHLCPPACRHRRPGDLLQQQK